MVFLDLLSSKSMISLTPAVAQFKAKDGSLLVKHKNKLFKVSGKSNVGWETSLFRFLRRPKKFDDILGLFSGFKRSDVIDLLETLYELDLIRFENLKIKESIDIKDRNNRLSNDLTDRNVRSQALCIIGNGVLADILVKHLKETKVKIVKFNSLQADLIQAEKKRDKGVSHRCLSDTQTKFYSSSSSLLNAALDKCSLIVVAEDYPNLALFETVNSESFRRNKPWLRISFDDNIGYMGPLVIPRKTPCFNCCQLRLITNSPDYEYELWENREFIPSMKLNAPHTFANILAIACVNEILLYLTKPSLPNTLGHIFEFASLSPIPTKHYIIQHPNCILCNPPFRKKRHGIPNSLSKDAPRMVDTAINIPNEINESNSPLSEDELLKRLRRLVDKKTGIIQNYEKLYESHPIGINFHHFSTATCSKPLRIGLDGRLTRPVLLEDSLISPSPSGSGLSANDAEVHTLMESVERYSNMVVDESRIILSSFNVLKRNAVNPVDLGLYSEEVYDRKDFNCSKFTVNSNIPWIEGFDLYSRRDVMVPADFVFYPAIRKKPLVFDTSNGSSAHVDYVRAILNGLYEVIERDSFLTMWLNKIPMPVLHAKTLPFGFDESLELINEYGMQVKLVDLTNDTAVPTIMAVCHNKDPNKYPALLVGTGCHIDPLRALQKALFEMEFMLSEFLERPNKKKINRADKIYSMFEHPLYYLNPNKRKYWEFMIRGSKKMTLQEKPTRSFKNNYTELMYIVKNLHAMNHRVVAVNITPTDISKLGLKAVKVFVTGLQPLYVGDRLRLNLERLRITARALSYNTDLNFGSTINLAPHPLP
ncbi:MAG TPA: TOMM precursor leader peptide-binding protein [Nitrososphaeraceae archaeon]|nr:TOMM precursor leader peptide-binding protein [Nitrososphaeraceae archaeon]